MVQVTGTASNNKLFTVEVLTDSGNIIFNQAHAGGTTTKSLVDETVSATVTLVARAKSAPIGLGQGYVDVSASRSAVTTYTNNTGRPFMLALSQALSSNHNFQFHVDSLTVADSIRSSNTVNVITNPIVPSGSTYGIAVLTGGQGTIWTEIR